MNNDTTFEFSAIGTKWHIAVYADLAQDARESLLLSIRRRIEEFESAYSRFRPDSIVAGIARESSSFVFPADSKGLFALYRDLYVRTNGYFTPLVGGMLVDAGYDADYSLEQKKKLEAPPSWDDVMSYDASSLTLAVEKPVRLDFGAAGKGYLIDIVGGLLDAAGYHGYLIDAGGDILHKGLATAENPIAEPARIGLEDPEHADKAIGVYPLANASICGSAGNRRAWGDFTHVMDPKALASPRSISAVWVVAEKAAIADALTTCLFFVDPDMLKPAYQFEYLIVRADRSISKSKGFAGEVFFE